MLAPIITKDMNPFTSQPRKARDVRTHSQNPDISKITISTNRNQNTVIEKSSQPLVKLRSTFVHGGSLNKPRVLPSIVEDVEMRLNLDISHKNEGSENARFKCTSLANTSDSTVIIVTTATTVATTITTTTSCSFSDSSLSSIIGRARSTVKKIQ
ncbi:hypothetical protein WUBG_09365 [Wuchereria bancrofti]|uniref:Uncharacterized protein n=2 Tax=Wuchereria bancrofti TaxID=6293 RepID=J9EBE6_WUCBA|nr:hypothetical protein WUBG_09365 [Wuchereria bancrofti]